DQGGLPPPQGALAEAELGHDPGAEVLRHYVGAVDELERDLPALGRFQIERHAALVAVGTHMHHALTIVPDIPAAPVALPSALGTLDRTDIGAEISQRLAAHWAEHNMLL